MEPPSRWARRNGVEIVNRPLRLALGCFVRAVDGTPVIVLSSLITDARELKGACLHAAGDAAAATRTRVGFTSVGMYRRHGKFDGEWRDCMIVEKIMGEAAEA